MHVLHTTLYIYISQGSDKDNFFNNQDLVLVMIISFILVASMCYLGVIL